MRSPLRLFRALAVFSFALFANVGLAAAQTGSQSGEKPPLPLSNRDLEVAKRIHEGAARFGIGTPEYIAALREENSKIRVEGLGGTRDVQPKSFETIVPKSPTVHAIDRDPRLRATLQKLPTAFKTRMWVGRPTEVNGVDQMKHTVALMHAQNLLCSGVLIDKGTVLTAAHCVCGLPGQSGPIRISFGQTIDWPNSYPVVKMEPRQCPTQVGEDLALLFFNDDASDEHPAAYIAPITDYFGVTDGLWVAGYGKTETGTAGRKLTAHIPIVSKNCGGASDPSVYGCVPGTEAVLSDNRHDSCKGDSGGPAYVFSGGRYEVAAIVSRSSERFAPPNPDDCGPGGVYSLLTPTTVNWIVETILQRQALN